MTNEIITPAEIIESGGKNYWKTEGKLYLPEDIDEETIVEVKPTLTKEERTIEEIAGPGKVVKEKLGLVVVGEPTTLEKVLTEAKEVLRRLTTPKILAYATGVALTIVSPMVLAGETPTSGSLELMTGNEYSTLDTKITTKVVDDVNLFLRQIITSTPEGEVSYFGLMDLSYNLVDGLDLVGEVQAAPGMGVVPRAGLQYFKAFGDSALYALATVSTMEHPDGEFVVNLSYSPELSENVDLLTNIEDLTSVGEDGHNFSVQKLRLGVTLMDRYQIGAAADLLELGNEGELSYNLGGFLGLKL
jgi:hypothetical protein